MTYSTNNDVKNTVKFDFVITADEFASAFNEAYQKDKGQYKVEGFRQGKVPKGVIESIYGKDVFRETATDIIMQKSFMDALKENETLSIVGRPSVDAIDYPEAGGVTFTISVTTKPEVKLGEYKGLVIQKQVAKVSDEQLDHELQEALEKQARMVEIKDAPAQKGNILNIDFSGSVDGVKFEGGTAEDYDLEIGSGSFIPGFEDQLIGMNEGESKDVKVTFPSDYHATDLAGKEAVFAVTVHSIKNKELPTLDDEFAKSVSEFDTLDAYKEDIKANLLKEAEKNVERDYEIALIEAICKNVELDIPQVMIEEQIDEMIEEFKMRLSYQGLKIEQYLSYIGKEIADIRKDYAAPAETRIRERLVLEEIIKAENLQIGDTDMDAKINDYAERMGKSVEDFKKSLGREQIDYLANEILTDKVIEFLKANNTANFLAD